MKKKNKKAHKSEKSKKSSNLKNKATRSRASASAKRSQLSRATERASLSAQDKPERVSGILVSLRSLDARELPRRIPKEATYRLYFSGKDDGADIFVSEYDPATDPIEYHEGMKVGVVPDYKTERRVCIRMGRYETVENTVMGRVTEVFGEPDSFEANYREIIYTNKVRDQFPSEVEREAEERAAIPLTEEGRQRPTQLPFTIDGADARDLDDAVSIEETNGIFRLGVHIADVSAYVLPESELMEEAMRRTCSSYFPSEVFPMLPRALSNGACSLNAGEDKYALSVYIDIDESGRALSTDIKCEIIRSQVRGVYSEVNDLLERGRESDFAQKYASVLPSIEKMNRLYSILSTAAYERGSVELDMPETVIIPAPDNGEPTIARMERGIAEKMIEQFMLAANTAVAEYCLKNRLPCVYRIHEQPDPLKLAELLGFAASLGITPARGARGDGRKTIKAILSQAKERGIAETLSYPILRSMAKAKYHEQNLGHFALALGEYCHFTSPIRRLSDLAVHTVLSRHLQGEDVNRFAKFTRKCAYEATEGEIRAAAAEREVTDLYCALWLSKHVGEEFEAKISSVTRFGFFVTLPNTCDGLVPISSLDGYFVFNESSLTLKKEGGGKSYRIGDRVRVKLEDVSLSSRRASFSVSEEA